MRNESVSGWGSQSKVDEMDWVKKTLFGRQLSYGSDNENPQNFEEAFQQQVAISGPEDEIQQQQMDVDPFDATLVQQQQQQTPLASYGFATTNVASANTANVASPGAQEMKVAYEVSKKLVRERMERENPEDVAILDSVDDTDIVCVQGTYDHIHLVLQAIGIPFTHVDPHGLMKIELKPEATVYVNCPSTFPRESALKLRKFVEEGGQLITTDWALKHVVEVAFPGTVKFSGKSSGDEVVAVEIVDKEDEILKGFIDQEKDEAPVWWLEGSSYTIEILDKKKVKVLMRSDELKRKYNHDAVIISFEWGKGVVYHMLSHFYLQRSETRTKKQGMNATVYAAAQGASKSTLDAFSELEKVSPGTNYGMVQSAATSSEFVSRGLVKQKRRFLSASKK